MNDATIGNCFLYRYMAKAPAWQFIINVKKVDTKFRWISRGQLLNTDSTFWACSAVSLPRLVR